MGLTALATRTAPISLFFTSAIWASVAISSLVNIPIAAWSWVCTSLLSTGESSAPGAVTRSNSASICGRKAAISASLAWTLACPRGPPVAAAAGLIVGIDPRRRIPAPARCCSAVSAAAVEFRAALLDN